jgi:hypothetical protein
MSYARCGEVLAQGVVTYPRLYGIREIGVGKTSENRNPAQENADIKAMRPWFLMVAPMVILWMYVRIAGLFYRDPLTHGSESWDAGYSRDNSSRSKRQPFDFSPGGKLIRRPLRPFAASSQHAVPELRSQRY